MGRRETVTVMLIAALACAGKEGRPSALAKAKAFAQAEVKIERMRRQEAPDWSAIKEEYETAAGVVGEMDELSGKNYDVEIREALERCSRGEEPRVNQQVLAKGLQHVAVLAMREELDAMAGADAAGRKAAAELVWAYFEGIRPTFARRDGDLFGGKSTLEATAERALDLLKNSAASTPGAILTARRELEGAIARTYALSVIYEVEGIEKLRDKDRRKCDVKRKEAEIFYRIIQPRISRRDPKADETICAMLAGDYGAVSAKEIEKMLRGGLFGIPLR